MNIPERHLIHNASFSQISTGEDMWYSAHAEIELAFREQRRQLSCECSRRMQFKTKNGKTNMKNSSLISKQHSLFITTMKPQKITKSSPRRAKQSTGDRKLRNSIRNREEAEKTPATLLATSIRQAIDGLPPDRVLQLLQDIVYEVPGAYEIASKSILPGRREAVFAEVLGISELIDNVLVYLPVEDIVRFRRSNKQFLGIIDDPAGHELQELLFLRARGPVHQNAGLYGSDELPTEQNDNLNPSGSTLAVDCNVRVVYGYPWNPKTRECEIEHHVPHHEIGAQLEEQHFHLPEGDIRLKMFITQPPITAVGLVIDGDTFMRWLKVETGIRFGDLLEFFRRSRAEYAEEPCYLLRHSIYIPDIGELRCEHPENRPEVCPRI